MIFRSWLNSIAADRKKGMQKDHNLRITIAELAETARNDEAFRISLESEPEKAL
jgi:hypothetical protein